MNTSEQNKIVKNEIFGGDTMKKLLKKRLNQKGLTLIELLAVIVILAIVAAIAIPAIGNMIENSRYNGVKSDAINVLNAANIYFTDNATETETTAGDLEKGGYLDSKGKINADAKIKRVNGGNTIKDTVTYSGSKKVIFNEATVNDINGDTEQKGSDDVDKTIPKPASGGGGGTP